jgi:hypothetical protein
MSKGHEGAREPGSIDFCGDAQTRRSSQPVAGKSAAQRMMERETRVEYGSAPHSLSDTPLRPTSWQMNGDEFLLRGEGDHFFYYRKGQGVTIERGMTADLSEEALWLNGSVYSAIASINGLVPIHASAVSAGGRVFAFTGPGGAGKSTLVAALAQKGLPMYCDDTLVLDLESPERILCLPGHKRLKLRPDAVELTGAMKEEKVSATVDKFYASPKGGSVAAPLPLAELIFLEDGPGIDIVPIVGAERFARMNDDHQTAQLHAGAHLFDKVQRFAHLGRLARQIRMARFVRPRSAEQFSEGVSRIADYISKQAS